MADFVLDPHPDFPSTAVRSIAVSASRRSSGQMDLEFRAMGAIDRILLPEWIGVAPADGLWRHSCFEAFVGLEGEPGYREFNFATSGQWAAYAFDAYREGMRPLDNALISGGGTLGDGELRIRRSVAVQDLADAANWRIGLASIIETKDGSKSYWALKHPPGKPDFHNADCFAGRIAAPTIP